MISARAEVASLYRPLLLINTLLYALCKWWWLGENGIGWKEWIVIVILGVIQYFSYVGILDNASNRAGRKSSDLAGGQALDWLGLSMLIQWSSLFSSKMYWMLVLFPVIGAYSMYTMFAGPKQSSNAATESTSTTTEDEALKEKRQKRAERRRRKW